MKRLNQYLAIAIVSATILAPISSPLQAGRTNGPMSSVSTVPGGASVFFDISFNAGDTAAVAITGDGSSIMHVIMYDSDGHIVIGDGVWDRRTAMMEVYRTGVFRVEVRNLGIQANTFTLSTN